MKLSDWCKTQGITYKTGWNWFKSGKLPVKAIQTPSGTILITDSVQNDELEKKECIIYCRVSSHDKKDDLLRQSIRCQEYAIYNGFVITHVYKEIGSGMNDKRTQLVKVLTSNTKYLIVEHKDRLTRFGFNYINILLKRLNTEVIVINSELNDQADLIKDLISIITSFCCRIYGMRRGYNKAKKISTDVKSDI